MVNGKYQTAEIDSYPAGAQVVLNCDGTSKEIGVTPASVRLLRAARQCSITLKKDGYAPKEVVLEKQQSRAMDADRAIAIPVGVVTAVFSWALLDSIGLEVQDEAITGSFAAGVEGGSAPIRQLDKHLGGAWKWVPGKIFIILLRPDQPEEPGAA
jgi:hypothetical protein